MSKKKKKRVVPDPNRYATVSIPKPVAPVAPDEPVAPGEPVAPDHCALASPGAPVAGAQQEVRGGDVPRAVAPLPAPTKLESDWLRGPKGMSTHEFAELRRRLLRCKTIIGVIASVHLERVSMRECYNADLGLRVYGWLFDAHHVVMGDMNCSWQNMIGGARLDMGARPYRPEPMKAWVKPTTHTAAIRHGGTYLPAVQTVRAKRFEGDTVAVTPPAFDLVVVARPLTVALLEKQPGARFTPTKLPRMLMKSLGWPSDHTSVVAVVSSMHRDARVTVATWNVADPWYFGRFWPDATVGFDADDEQSRLDAIESHVATLLDIADVVGLQEVPALLVSRIVQSGIARGFASEWMATPSFHDAKVYDEAVGKRGSSSDADSESPPPVAHDVLLARRAVLVE
jgi:hypothetical protein